VAYLRSSALFGVVYVALAIAFSFMGFVAQQPTVHFHEYSLPEAVLEVGGHFLFGAVAALLHEPLPPVRAGALWSGPPPSGP